MPSWSRLQRFILCLVVVGSLAVPRVAFTDPPQGGLAELVAAAKPAVVYVVVATNSGAQSGSGFVYKSDNATSTIITANHVVEGGTQVDVIFDSDTHERYPAQVIKRDHKRDVAILRVNVGHRPTLLLDSSRNIEEGTSIIVLGYPRTTLVFRRIAGDDLRPTVHSGIISAIRLNGELIQFDAITDHGDSGGPVIDVSTGRVVAVVHGVELDPSYAARGLEQPLPGSFFGPSAMTIASVFNSTPQSGGQSVYAAAPVGTVSGQGAEVTGTMTAGTGTPSNTARSPGADSASYRVGYGVPTFSVTSGSTDQGNSIDENVNTSVLQRLQNHLQEDNSLYLIPLQISGTAVQDSDHLVAYCDDNRLNAIAFPVMAWNLTGGPRYNGYGSLVGYSGQAAVRMNFYVYDCFGIPFFAESKTKSEDRYFAHRTPEREIVDMANDLLDQLLSDFDAAKSQNTDTWNNLLKTGLAISPSDQKYHSMMYFQKKPEGYQVTVVVPNGPADRAGVKVKDIILKINGQDASGLSVQDFVAKLNVPEYTIEVQRPGGDETITVRASQYQELVKLLQH